MLRKTISVCYNIKLYEKSCAEDCGLDPRGFIHRPAQDIYVNSVESLGFMKCRNSQTNEQV
jgi:hypothetical protein